MPIATPATNIAVPDTVTGWRNGGPSGASGEQIPVINPADGTVLTRLVQDDVDSVDAAVRSARARFEAGDWSRAPVKKRQRVLSQTAELIRSNAEELATLDTHSTGLLYHRSMLPQVEAAACWFEYFADLIGRSEEARFQTTPGIRTAVSREPAGVAALFTPWNIPVMGAALKLSAALGMGNSVILKPSEQSPLGALRLVQLIHEAGIPEGVLQLVNGRGAVTGAALANHPDVNLVSFTGGEGAGRSIAQAAAGRFAKVTMELGGKSANIVFADADYHQALEGALAAAFGNSGQACLAGSRLLIESSIADRFIADLVSRAEAICVGEPFDPAAEIGPQSSEAQMRRVLSYADVARADGDEILTGGHRVDTFPDGFYVTPTIVRARSNASRICQEEVFGPIVSLLTFDSEADAVRIANDSCYGLAGYVWSNDRAKAERTAAALRSGYVLVNTPMVRERNAPFGGFGHSGIDREGGRWSLDFYSEAKTTVIKDGENAK